MNMISPTCTANYVTFGQARLDKLMAHFEAEFRSIIGRMRHFLMRKQAIWTISVENLQKKYQKF
jgi:hypothetical protein